MYTAGYYTVTLNVEGLYGDVIVIRSEMILTFIIFPLNCTYRAFQTVFCFEDIKYIRKTTLVSINANSKIVMDLDKTHILLLFVSTRMKNLRTTTSKKLPISYP